MLDWHFYAACYEDEALRALTSQRIFVIRYDTTNERWEMWITHADKNTTWEYFDSLQGCLTRAEELETPDHAQAAKQSGPAEDRELHEDR